MDNGIGRAVQTTAQVYRERITVLEAENAALREKYKRLEIDLEDTKSALALAIIANESFALTPPSPAKPACGCQTTEYPHWSRISYTDGVPYCDDCGTFYSPPAKPAQAKGDSKPDRSGEDGK